MSKIVLNLAIMMRPAAWKVIPASIKTCMSSVSVLLTSKSGSIRIPDYLDWESSEKGILCIFILSFLEVPRIFTNFTPKEGLSVFAIAYIQAQFIERIVEPFSEVKITRKGLFGKTDEIITRKRKIATNKLKMESLALKPDMRHEVDSLEDESNKESKVYDKESAKRVYSFWGLNSLLGMILVYFTVGLFETLGANFSINAAQGHFWDALFSGVVIGGGTKPLHDLIGYIQNQKEKD